MSARARTTVLAVVIVATAAAQWADATTGTAATVGSGPGFDTCQAPPMSSMQAWRAASPYRTIGVYIGGADRACSDGPLSAAWIASAQAAGWLIAPLYVGLQSPCAGQQDLAHFDPRQAALQGSQSADDAAAIARTKFAIPPGSPIYFDMEAYDRNAPGCSGPVLAFVDGWTRRLHDHGYLSGVYGSAGSLMADLVGAVGRMAEPDAIWNGHWDGRPTPYGDATVPDSLWVHQRIHQYVGGHDERFGGVTLNIDNDFSDGLFAGSDERRAVLLRSDGHSGYVLDGYGTLQPFGGAPGVATSSWPGWDIARAAVLRSDGVSGYVLDGWGGVHPFGGAPAVRTTTYWRGWDIARGLVLRPDGASGYVLDGWGGLHPFGDAPAASGGTYRPGFDVARGLALVGSAGEVVDAAGSTASFSTQ